MQKKLNTAIQGITNCLSAAKKSKTTDGKTMMKELKSNE